MARCNCNPGNNQCLSPQTGNLLSYDASGCLFAAYTPDTITGQSSLLSDFDMTALADNVWTDLAVTVTLPSAGTYALIGDFSGQAAGSFAVPAPPAAGQSALRVWGRIFNVTTGSSITGGRVVAGVVSSQPGRFGVASSASAHAYWTVNAPTTIRLQAQKVTTQGTGVTVTPVVTTGLFSPSTSLYYQKIA